MWWCPADRCLWGCDDCNRYSAILIWILIYFPTGSHRFQVYDADSYVRCRYHLLERSAVSQKAVPPSITSDNQTFASVLPGTPGRWRLPPDSSGLTAFGHMMHRVSSMSQVYTLYYVLQVWSVNHSSILLYFLTGSRLITRCIPMISSACGVSSSVRWQKHLPQGVVLLMLIIHLIHAIGFQPRLSVIPGTLYVHSDPWDELAWDGTRDRLTVVPSLPKVLFTWWSPILCTLHLPLWSSLHCWPWQATSYLGERIWGRINILHISRFSIDNAM